MASQVTALAAAGLAGMFEGSALFMSVGFPVPYYDSKEENTQELLQEWRRMFPPAAKVQGSIDALGALASGATALAYRGTASEWSSSVAVAFGLAAACQVTIWAFTMTHIMPVNKVLLPKGEVEKAQSEGAVRELLKKWGRLHAVRVALGGVALGSCLYGLGLMLKKE